MGAGIIAAIIIVVVLLAALFRMVRIVPQARAAVVERLGRYVRTATPGLTLLLPFVDRMRPLIDLREQVVSFPPQPVITSDNLTVAIDSVIYFQVTDPRAATYEIQNYIQAVEQLTITTLRNVVGSLNLEQALTSRDEINTKLRGVLDEATGPWGIRVARVEIKAIDPPPSIQDAMEQQMRADRNKRAIILTAEGQRESAIKTAEGQKAAQILGAEGQKQAAILAAEAERQSRILRAEGDRAARYLTAQGQAKAVETTFAAIHAGRPDPALLAYQYLQTLPQIAQGDANKVWVIPSEFSKALEGLAKLGGVEGADSPSWMQATGTEGPPAPSLDASTWFDSNLPPAHLQPEAVNLRASDDDPESLEAHAGLPPDDVPLPPLPSFDDQAAPVPPVQAPPPVPPQAAPPQQYGTPGQYAPPQQYGVPEQQYGTPGQYGPAQQYGVPEQYAPPQQYGVPEQYGPPQQYGVPEQPPAPPQPPAAPQPPSPPPP